MIKDDIPAVLALRNAVDDANIGPWRMLGVPPGAAAPGVRVTGADPGAAGSDRQWPRARHGESAPHALPRSGTRRPWNVRHNYVLDVIDHRFDRIEESMVFGRAPVRAVTSA